jgi:hypothetical protein
MYSRFDGTSLTFPIELQLVAEPVLEERRRRFHLALDQPRVRARHTLIDLINESSVAVAASAASRARSQEQGEQNCSR